MSRRDMKVGPIETKMIGIDRKALGQIFEDFLWFIKLKNSIQITQQTVSNIQDVAVPENDHHNSERCMPVSTLGVQIRDFSLTAYVSHWVLKTWAFISKRQYPPLHFIACVYTRRKIVTQSTQVSNYVTIDMFRRHDTRRLWWASTRSLNMLSKI